MTKPLVEHQLDRQEGKRGAGGVSIVVDPISVGRVLPRAGSSGLSGAAGARSSAGARKAAANTISSGCISGEPFLVVLIIFVVTIWELLATQTRLVNEEVSASLPAHSDAVPDVSWSWLSGCRPGAEEGRR
jgi:hypothetical protein